VRGGDEYPYEHARLNVWPALFSERSVEGWYDIQGGGEEAADKVLDVEVPIRRFAECPPDCGNRVGIRCQEPLAYKVGDVLGASAAGR
jgi:hypothetical protein